EAAGSARRRAREARGGLSAVAGGAPERAGFRGPGDGAARRGDPAGADAMGRGLARRRLADRRRRVNRRKDAMDPSLKETLLNRHVRDRLSAGLAAAPHERAPSWWARWRRSASAPDPWREGLAMTLRPLDRVLADRRVTPIVTVGRPFSPAVAQAVATRDDPSVAEGWVIAESRAGFEWDGELLRAAEVIVAK